MRTALACVAIGVGFHALFQKIHPAWLPRSIATGFLVLGVAVIILAERRAAAVTRRLSGHVVKTAGSMNLRVFAAMITLGTVALIAAIWLLELK